MAISPDDAAGRRDDGPTLTTALRRRLLWKVASPLFRGLGRAIFTLRIEYEAPLPAPPFVVAANHYSHFDGPLVGAALGMPVRFLVVEDLFGNQPLLDWLVLGAGAIPLPRRRLPLRALRTAFAALESGEVVGIFPEGTRVTHWTTLPAKRGAGWLAARAEVPLVPVAVIGTGIAFGLDKRVRRAPIRVVVGPPLRSGDTLELTDRWSAWISETIARFPGSEVAGPKRAFFSA